LSRVETNLICGLYATQKRVSREHPRANIADWGSAHARAPLRRSDGLCGEALYHAGVVLLLLASLMAAILVLAIVFILFLEEISRAVLWKKRAIVSLADSRDELSSLHPEKVVSLAKP
jgi:hypothetical protein